jgi:hypothetical protein
VAANHLGEKVSMVSAGSAVTSHRGCDSHIIDHWAKSSGDSHGIYRHGISPSLLSNYGLIRVLGVGGGSNRIQFRIDSKGPKLYPRGPFNNSVASVDCDYRENGYGRSLVAQCT